MKSFTIALFATLVLVNVSSANGQTLYTCGDGNVREVHLVQGTMFRVPLDFRPDAWGEPQQVLEPAAEDSQAEFLVSVQLRDTLYTVRASLDDSWNLNPWHLRDNEQLAICVNRDRMVLDRQDGTDLRGKVVATKPVRMANATR